MHCFFYQNWKIYLDECKEIKDRLFLYLYYNCFEKIKAPITKLSMSFADRAHSTIFHRNIVAITLPLLRFSNKESKKNIQEKHTCCNVMRSAGSGKRTKLINHNRRKKSFNPSSNLIWTDGPYKSFSRDEKNCSFHCSYNCNLIFKSLNLLLVYLRNFISVVIQ